MAGSPLGYNELVRARDSHVVKVVKALGGRTMTISFNQFVWNIVKQLHELSPDALDALALRMEMEVRLQSITDSSSVASAFLDE